MNADGSIHGLVHGDVPGAGGVAGGSTDWPIWAGAPGAEPSLGHRGAAGGLSWESECACPGPCPRDHERD
jgi:hypothetical protein